MKKFTAIFMAGVLGFMLLAPSAWAGSKQRHRWEGVAIGLGAAVLGHAVIQGHRQHFEQRHQPVIIHNSPESCYYPPRQGRDRYQPPPCGYWEYRKVWVAPAYEKVWNPGHYNDRGVWIAGEWIHIEKEPGRWVEERVWIDSRR